ncbi:MAG TPA: TolC family protein [Gemmatimonadaceae bacterium]|nr:TolC family protein [Gemmatimonadaceae bacterium]
MRFLMPLAAVALLAQTAQAQTKATLTLDEAITLARRNNPTFRTTVNARRSADAQMRSAFAGLLPSVSANLSGRYQQTGQQFVQGIALQNQSDILQSSYGIGVSYTLNSDVLTSPRQTTAARNAAEADVTGASELLRATVTQQYLLVLQSQARAALQDTLLQTTQGQLELAKARQAVGAGTILDVRRAEVAAGNSEVQVLQSHNTAEVEMLRLFQQLGVSQPDSIDLTTRFEIIPVNFDLDSLLAVAQARNPLLEAARSREHAATVNVRANQGRYLPSLTLQTGWGGNASKLVDEQVAVANARGAVEGRRSGCFAEDSLRAASGMARLDCSVLPQWSSTLEQNTISQNNRFPFSFTPAPRSVSAFVSLPIFDNLVREQRLQEASIQRDNAKLTVRARELQTIADVTQAYRNLQTAVRTTQLQEVNAQRAREELSFAEERYRVGAATFLDVTTSRGTFEQAQIDRLNASYDYHRAFAALENAVGRPLR